jgi:tryptophan synthase beta chain
MHAHLFTSGRGEFHSVTDQQAMEAGKELAALEGIIPAIETAHAFAVLNQRTFRPEDILVFNLSGRGDKDLQTYIEYFNL